MADHRDRGLIAGILPSRGSLDGDGKHLQLPVLEATMTPEVDGHAASRPAQTRDQDAEFIVRAERRAGATAELPREG